MKDLINAYLKNIVTEAVEIKYPNHFEKLENVNPSLYEKKWSSESLKEEIELNNEITNSIKNCPDKNLVERVKLDLARLMELTKKKEKQKQQSVEIETGFERER